MSAVLLKNVRLLDPATGSDRVTHVRLEAGVITHIGDCPETALTLDRKDCWLLPGLIDLCARLREPGASSKGTIHSETHAALAAGIHHVVMPPDTSPVADTRAVVDRIHALARDAGAATVHVLGALTQGLRGEALAELSALKAAGVVGVSNGLQPLANLLVARRALEYAQGLGLTVHVVALDAALANGGCAHEGAMATRLGLAAIPAAAEVAAIRQWISLVEDTGAAVHFGRLSSARGAELVESAQARKLPVTADVAIHQLLLTDAALEGFNAMAHVMPPLRSADDRDALRGAVAKGVISAICSDHQPHEPDAKVNPFPLTEPGISCVDSLLSLSLRLVEQGLLSPLQWAARLASGPAAVLKMPAPRIAVGEPARLILVDPSAEWFLNAATMKSRGHNTPFLGERLLGRVLPLA